MSNVTALRPDGAADRFAYRHITVEPVTPTISAEISGVDLRQPIDADPARGRNPAVRGDTVFTNLVAAYQGLSTPIRTLVDRLQAVHRTSAYDGGNAKPRRDGRSAGPFVSLHPLVCIHPETGESVLFLNPGTISHIVGLKEPESKALLDLLFYEATRPEYQVRFHWNPKSLVVWDNQAVAHAGPIDYAQFDLPRAVRRITVAGDLTRGPDGFFSQPLEGPFFNVLG